MKLAIAALAALLLAGCAGRTPPPEPRRAAPSSHVGLIPSKAAPVDTAPTAR